MSTYKGLRSTYIDILHMKTQCFQSCIIFASLLTNQSSRHSNNTYYGFITQHIYTLYISLLHGAYNQTTIVTPNHKNTTNTWRTCRIIVHGSFHNQENTIIPFLTILWFNINPNPSQNINKNMYKHKIQDNHHIHKNKNIILWLTTTTQFINQV